MNNNQFRRLVLDTPIRQDGAPESPQVSSQPANLGAKKSSFVPMTPRTVKGGIDVDFARQVRERNAALRPSKFKSSAPKGVKYGAGYIDRAKTREQAGDEQNSKAERIKALEEQMKLGRISIESFEALRDEITGGDISNTHLIKGLDRKLLQRVRKGEDVLELNQNTSAPPTDRGGGKGDASTPAEAPPNVDDELDRLGEKDVQAIKRQETEKRGSMAAPAPVAGKKRTRDEILAELKAQRHAAAQTKSSALLDGRWRKVGEKEKSRIEIDHKGREVLITVDEDGVVKKKVRKAPEKVMAGMPDGSKPVLGADAVIPDQAPNVEQHDEEDEDIFEGAGTEYNPLGDVTDDDGNDSDSDSEGDSESKPAKASEVEAPPASAEDDEEREAKPYATHRNYFGDRRSESQEQSRDRFVGLQDVLKKAARLHPPRSDPDSDDPPGSEQNVEARLKKRAQVLAQRDRDLDDLDMGFGSSRYEDEDDGGEGKKSRLSEWKGAVGGDDDGWEGESAGGGSSKKKRKPKKRKGDANNAADIMRVIEGRKAGTAK